MKLTDAGFGWALWEEDYLAWFVWEDSDFGVQLMTDTEIQKSIVDDLISLLGHGIGGVHWFDFFRFVRSRKQRERVLNALLVLIDGNIVEDNGGYIHFEDRRESLQSAMDFAEHWLEGFDMPDGVICTTPLGQEMIEQIGVNGMAELLSAELACQHLPQSVH